MAYKFSLGTRVLSGNLIVSGNISSAYGGPDYNGDIVCADDFVLSSDSCVINFGADKDTTLTHTDGAGLTLNGANKIMFNDASQFIHASSATVLELGATDEIGLTATAVDMDANLDLDGTANISGLVTVQTGLVPDASDGAYLGTSALEWSDLFLADGAVISLGDGGADVTLTHVADTGVQVNGANKIMFNDASQFIHASSATILELGATDEIGLTATSVDMDANLDLDGTANISGLLSIQTGIAPAADDGAYLGTSDIGWSDLFLAEGGVINWDDGDMTITQASNVMTVAGGTLTATLTNALACDTAESGLDGTDYDGSAGVTNWKVDLNDLAAAAVDVGNDSIAIIDADDSNGTKKESVSDFAAALVGGGSKVYGLDSASGLIKLDISTLSTALTGASIDGMDLLALDDVAGGSGQSKITVAGLAAKMAGAGLTAVNGVLRTDAGGTPNAIVHGEQLSEGWNYLTGTLAGAATISLPNLSAPTVGDTYYFKAGAGVDGTRTVTIACSGAHKIDNESSIVLESPYGAISLVYMVSGSWSIF